MFKISIFEFAILMFFRLIFAFFKNRKNPT
nr:MAG TPA: hypothetical protein [Caudoviricetes sp.]